VKNRKILLVPMIRALVKVLKQVDWFLMQLPVGIWLDRWGGWLRRYPRVV
jgi:hypothetical protein